MSGWFQGKSGQTEATKTASETGQSVQDRAIEAKDQTISFIGEKSEGVTKAASETAEAAMKMGGDAMGKASETGQAITDRAVQSKDQTFGFFGEKTEAAKKMAVDTTQVKAGEATKMASETGQSIQDRAVEAKDQTGGFLGEKSEAVTKAASETTEAAKKMGGEAMGKASETVQASTDRAVEGKDQAGGFLGEKTEAVKKTATETTDAAKQKSTETAQYVQDNAAQYTKDSPVASKENVFQQAGGQMMGAAAGAKDAVMNTLGMGGDKGDAGSAK